MKTDAISIDRIRIDGGTQPRKQLDTKVIADYAEQMKAGNVFPPVTVFHDGKDYWLADGFHRYHAARTNKAKSIRCEVHQGTQRDAILHSVGANAAHGLRRTNEDKREAVMTLLRDEEWSKWSDNEIARQCAVDHKTVGKYRTSLGNFPSERKGKDGRTINTANIGRKTEQQKRAEEAGDQADARQAEAEALQASVESHDAADADPVNKPTDPLEAINADIDRIAASLKAVARDMRESFGFQKDKQTSEYRTNGLHKYTYSATVGSVNSIVATLEDERPVEMQGEVVLTKRGKALQEAREGKRR